MTIFQAPIRDMRFVIEELIGIDRIGRLGPFAQVNGELLGQILNEAARLGEQVLAPINSIGDVEGCRLEDHGVVTYQGARDAYRHFVNGGWTGIGFPIDEGGGGMPALLATATGEIWAAANMAFSLCPLLTQGAVELLIAHGTEMQKRLYLPRLVSGEWTGAQVLTEPQAGSEVGALRTRAVRDGERWRITGQKIFITWGDHDMAENVVHMVLARIQGAPDGIRGVSLFLVPKFLVNDDGSLGARNDMRCVSLERKLGIHGSPTCVMAYGDNEGAVGWLIGEENRGIDAMFTMMNSARLGVGLEGLGLAERSYQQARAYARARMQGRAAGSATRGTIIHHPDVRRMLMTMKASIEAVRALDYTAAAALDESRHHGDPAMRDAARARLDLLIPLVKGWGTEVGVEVASLGIQVHGGTGFIEETGAAQHLRDARITPIYEGTNGIQALDLVTRKIGIDDGAAVSALLDDMRATVTALDGIDHPDLPVIARVLSDGSQILEATTLWMQDRLGANPLAAAAGAAPYLRLFAIVTGGWLMARSAGVAARRLEEAGANDPFYRTKLVTARFYAEHVMPQITALARMATTGAETVMALDEAEF